MLTFALIAGTAALLAAILIVRPLLGNRSEVTGQDALDAQVFRDQLAEVDRDLDRGTISATEAEGARVEVSRRLLAAANRAEKAARIGSGPQGASGMVAGLALIGTPALAAGLYLWVGAPGLPDQPLAERQAAVAQAQPRSQGQIPTNHPATDRPTQAQAEAQMAAQLPPAPEGQDPEYEALVARLQGVVAERPDDVQGRRLLADGLMRLGRWGEAWRQYDEVITRMGEEAGPELYGNLAEGLILAAGGYVSLDAEGAITQALRRDPNLPMGRYYAGLALRQAGRLDDAISMWEGLRASSAPDAPYLEWLEMMIAETIEVRDGGQIAAAPAAPAPGPSQDDIAAAQDMTPEDRMAMVENMVSSLNERLTTRGGTPEEWARLMTSYATLNRPEEAMRVFELASAAYPGGEEGVQLYEHATRLGLTVSAATAPPGPTQDDIDAAQQMSAKDRAEMIQGMVSRLEGRLTTEGGSAEEWLRLIRSLVQLERREDAARIFQLADAELEAKSDPSRGFVKEQTLLMGVPIE